MDYRSQVSRDAGMTWAIPLVNPTTDYEAPDITCGYKSVAPQSMSDVDVGSDSGVD